MNILNVHLFKEEPGVMQAVNKASLHCGKFHSCIVKENHREVNLLHNDFQHLNCFEILPNMLKYDSNDQQLIVRMQ
jgi:hypothetical protein